MSAKALVVAIINISTHININIVVVDSDLGDGAGRRLRRWNRHCLLIDLSAWNVE